MYKKTTREPIAMELVLIFFFFFIFDCLWIEFEEKWKRRKNMKKNGKKYIVDAQTWAK